MYVRLAQETGWTWEYIGQHMTLPRLAAFSKKWSEIPPLADAVAALAYGFGVLKKRSAAPAEGTQEHQDEVAQFIEGMPVNIRKRPA